MNKKITCAFVLLGALLPAVSAMAMDKTATGAVVGATVGAAAGKDVKSAVGGAVVGAGTGAMTKSGDTGKAARQGGAAGAATGAVVAAATGKSVVKGADRVDWRHEFWLLKQKCSLRPYRNRSGLMRHLINPYR